MNILEIGMMLSSLEKSSVFRPYQKWLDINGYKYQLHHDIIPTKVRPNDKRHRDKESQVFREVQRLSRF